MIPSIFFNLLGFLMMKATSGCLCSLTSNINSVDHPHQVNKHLVHQSQVCCHQPTLSMPLEQCSMIFVHNCKVKR
jgi:hypothetical protein